MLNPRRIVSNGDALLIARELEIYFLERLKLAGMEIWIDSTFEAFVSYHCLSNRISGDLLGKIKTLVLEEIQKQGLAVCMDYHGLQRADPIVAYKLVSSNFLSEDLESKPDSPTGLTLSYRGVQHEV